MDNQQDEEEPQEQKRKKFLLLVLWIGEMGAKRFKAKTEAKLGNVYLYNEKEKRFMPHEFYIVPGFGVSDLLDEKNRRSQGQGGALNYMKFSESELEQFFEELSKLNPPLIKQIDEIDGEKRYGLEDKKLGDFLSDCWYLFLFVKNGLEAKWRYLKRPTRGEYEWYRFFYGSHGARLYFTRLFEEKGCLSKGKEFQTIGLAHWDSRKRKEYFTFHGKKTVEENHDTARRRRTFIDREYKDIIGKYPIARPLIEKIYSPVN
jgi:hypothetical protein